MPKPIVVMYLPENYSNGRWNASVVMNILNNNYPPEEGNKHVSMDYWTQYYWLVFEKYGIDAPELQVFYEKDFTPIKFEELKQFIEEALKENKK